MIEITTIKGETYKFDPTTQRLFKDGVFIPSSMIEPVYSGNDKNDKPIFAGLYNKSNNTIITKTGKIKQVVDINSIK